MRNAIQVAHASQLIPTTLYMYRTIILPRILCHNSNMMHIYHSKIPDSLQFLNIWVRRDQVPEVDGLNRHGKNARMPLRAQC